MRTVGLCVRKIRSNPVNLSQVTSSSQLINSVEQIPSSESNDQLFPKQILWILWNRVAYYSVHKLSPLNVTLSQIKSDHTLSIILQYKFSYYFPYTPTTEALFRGL